MEFQEFDGQLLSVAVRTWQTLIVGESSLFDVDNYEHAALRYFVVSFLFFVCNIVLMNIFISVTGAGYEEERANIVGTFSAERFRVCMESVEVTGWSRFFVLVAMVCGLCIRMMVSLALGEVWTFVTEVLALLIWLMLFLLQWHFCQEVAKLRVKPEDFDPEARKYLWICVPSQRLEVDEDATDVSLNETPALNGPALLNRYFSPSRLEASAPTKSRTLKPQIRKPPTQDCHKLKRASRFALGLIKVMCTSVSRAQHGLNKPCICPGPQVAAEARSWPHSPHTPGASEHTQASRVQRFGAVWALLIHFFFTSSLSKIEGLRLGRLRSAETRNYVIVSPDPETPHHPHPHQKPEALNRKLQAVSELSCA